MNEHRQRLSEAFRALESLAEGGSPTLSAIVQEMGRRGHAMVILFLTLPFSLPLPVWGLSTPFGLVIALTALHMTFTQRLWLPRRLAARTVPADTVRAISAAAQRVLVRTERFVRPRGRFFHTNAAMVRLNGLLMFLAGVFLALPLPIPGTNLAPSWVILLICIGTLEEDGLLVVLGYGAFAIATGIGWLLLWPLLNWEQVLGWFGL